MKRTFHVIVILITLSLLGLFIIQSSWLNNLFEIRNAELLNKSYEAASNVTAKLTNNAPASQRLRLPKRGGLTFNPDFYLHILKPPTIDQRFTFQDVHKMVRQEFDAVGLKEIKF